jgi:parallel beta-helix repeat protein
MKQPAALFPIALALGAIVLVPEASAREPLPIKACQTISQPGSYELANNLTATGDCLVITASFVTIDLAGFSISSSNIGVGTAISESGAPPFEGIAIRNGSISGFATAVNLDAAGGSVVEGLRVFGFFRTGISANGIVRGNTVGESNTPVTSSGINAAGIVTDNYVTGIGRGTGISATGTVRGNTATDNAEGIHAGAGSTVIGNTVMNNRGFIGIGISTDCPSNLTDNTAVNSSSANLVLNGEGCHNEDNVAP